MQYGNYKVLKTGTCALSNSGVDTVDGLALVDFKDSSTPMNLFLSFEIEVRDSAGHIIRGWLKESY